MPEVPGGEGKEDRPAARERSVEIATLALVLAFSALLMWDNWRTGIDWESSGPKPGYFPFYVALICAGAAVFGLVKETFFSRDREAPFVGRGQLKRVMQVFLPTLL